MDNITIYVIDDDPAICRVLYVLLTSVNYDCKTFTDGKSFLTHYQANEKGCLLIDVQMPELSGPEIFDEIKIKKYTLPVIFMSGHADSDLGDTLKKAGAFAVISKPFNNQYLLNTVNDAVKQHLQR